MSADAELGGGPSESGARVRATPHGTHQVELWGAMPVGWLGTFSRGATRLRIDIVRGVARRSAERHWSAQFEVRGGSTSHFEEIDFLALTQAADLGSGIANLELRRFELTRSSERNGALALRLQARDRVGFLASLLGHLAGFVLFPEEISLDTSDGEADDMLWLSSVGGQSPPPEIETALRASLRACTLDRGSLFPST